MASPVPEGASEEKLKGSLNRSLPAKTSELVKALRSNEADDNSSESSEHSGRGHTASSLPRTRFTQTTPHSQREAINKLKTRMTFSDQSANSSGQSSPKRKLSIPSLDEAPPISREPDELSEGEVPPSISIQTILSKLDSVKIYLKEAENLQKHLKESLSPDEATGQMEKLERLIKDLRQQETTYLSILLRIMDKDDSQMNTTQETDESEYSEDGSSDEEDHTILQEPSLSLKSQLDNGELMTAEQEEELRVLRQQQQMLRDLIEQQEKLKALEERQAELLRKKADAQRSLAEAEAKAQLYREQVQEASLDPQTVPSEPSAMDEEAHRAALMSRIRALQERKEKIEGLMNSFTQMQLEGDVEDSQPSSQVEVSSAEGGASEALVPPTENNGEMEALETKLRQAAEAKQKLLELREMIDGLKKTAAGGEEPLSWRLSLDPKEEGSGDSQPPGDDTLDTTLDKQEELDESLVIEYQQRLARKRQEVAELQRQKEELVRMQSKILAMQEKYLDDNGGEEVSDDTESEEEGALPPGLAEELERQQQLYQEIMAKTKKLKELRAKYQDEAKNSEHDTYSLTSSTRLLTDADLTAATWGGSTVQSEDSEDSASNASGPVVNTGGATAVQNPQDPPQERVKFSVTRHTPRRQPARRMLSDDGSSPQNIDKKRKLNSNTSTEGPAKSGGATNNVGHLWPGILFPQRQPTRSSSTQTASQTTGASADPQVTFFSDMCSELLRGQNALIHTLCQRVNVDSDMNQLINYHRDLDMYYQSMCQAYAQLQQASGSAGSHSEPADEATPRAESFQSPSAAVPGPPPSMAPPQTTPFPRPPYQPGWYSNSPMVPTLSPYSSQVGSPMMPWSLGFSGPSQMRFTGRDMAQGRAGIRDSVLNSPSGITTASVQVQAPSTPPPSATPSMNNQPTYCFGQSQATSGPQLPSTAAKTETGLTVTQSAPSLPTLATGTDNTQIEQSEGFSVFDALRETIYSEVATLIANNESRPHYLVELFRELQLLNSDYLRQRALYNIQDLVTRVLTEENKDTNKMQDWTESDSSLDNNEGNPPPASNSTSDAFDYVELVQSGTSLTTPPTSDHPFTDLGDTVIRLDKALAEAKSAASNSSQLAPPVVSPGPLVKEESEPEATTPVEFDRQVLDDHIKDIMTEVIPVLKANMSEQCSQSMLDQIKSIVMDLVLKQESNQNAEFLEMLTKQLESTVTDTLNKYINKQFKDCGEDMLVDLSEVLLNELSFFRLMQNMRDHPQLGSDFRSVTSSQTTTEPEDNEPAMDPILLGALALQASRTLVDEEEALGKTRDDEMAKTWEPAQESDGEKDDKVEETSQDDQAGIESAGAITTELSVDHPVGQCVDNTPISLEVQMKQEQESTEGIPGIIASIEQQGQELAGDELPATEP